jgi:hypothetical protein
MENSDKIVFHYTSLDGLLGITETASIWGTNILYLNDATEFNYAKSLLGKAVKTFCTVNPKFSKQATLDESMGYFFFEILEENINKLLPSEHFSFYVCSFSEEHDLLSQWRGYCRNGSGYSLGFALGRLEQCVKQAGFAIKPCIYDEGKQIQEINLLLQRASDRFLREIDAAELKGKAWDTKGKYLAADFLLKFIQLAPFLKHPKFAEEREWRIIASLKTNYVRSQIKFRAGNTIVVPYIEIPLPKQAEHLIIDEIFIGPTSERELSMASVDLLLKSRNVNCSKVGGSTIPFRTV